MFEPPIVPKTHIHVPLPVVLVFGIVASIASYHLTYRAAEKYLDWRDPLWRLRGMQVIEIDTDFLDTV